MLLLLLLLLSLQSCPTLCDPIDVSPPGSPVTGIVQARTLEWVAISFSNTWKWKVKGKPLSCARLFKSTIVHHKLTQCCISTIIKQKEKSLNPCSLRLPRMVFLGSSGWGKKKFRIVLNRTERGTLVVWGLFQEKPLNSPEATAGNRILNPTRVGSHTGTPSPAAEHRHHWSQHCQPDAGQWTLG